MRFFKSASLLVLTCCTDLVFAHGVAIIEEVVVKGRKANLIDKAMSASQGGVSQEELAMRPILRTGEILELVPGMVATQHSGSGKANQYFLRGFNLDHGTDFATFVDSMPVNMRSHGHGQGYTDLNFIIPELVGSIDYKKGAYYSQVGDFSGAGSSTIHSATTLNANQLALSLGGYGYGRGLVIGETANQLIYGLEHQIYEGPWDDVDEDVNKTNAWLKKVWGQASHQVSLTFMAYDNQWNSADQIPSRAVQGGIISELGSLDTTLGGESSRYSLSARWQKGDHHNRWVANVYAINYAMSLWSNFTYYTSPQGDQFEQVDDRMIYGGDVAYSREGDFLGRPTSNTVGLQTRFDDISEVGLYSSAARQRTGVVRADSVDQYSISGYWQNTLQWSRQLRSVMGVRYDSFNFAVDPIAAKDETTPAQNAGKADDDIVSASFNLIYVLNDNYETYASIGQGFHSNDARGTTIQADPTTGDALMPVDPLVDSLGYELGVRAYRADKLNASLALWRLDIDSELLFVGDEGITEDTGVGSRRQGLEATAYYALDERWNLDLEYAYTHARLNTPGRGEKIPGALESVISAGLHTQWSDDFYSHLRLRYFGDYPLDGGETAPASTLLNLRMGYQVAQNFTITADILNLLDSNDHDVEYFYQSQLAHEPAPVADHHYHVFEPRTLRVHLAYFLE